MIDKSIRQHYQEGKNVNQLTKWKEQLTGNVKEKYMPEGKLDVGQLAKTALTNKLTSAATKKLAGTGILSSLGPIGMLISYMLAKKGMTYASGKMPDIKTSLQAFQTGFGSPAEGRELRVLENRRANMLQRKDEGKKYSERNLDIVTRAIAEAKGLDINNPNEMKNIDKPITQIQIEKSITEPSIIPGDPEVKIPHLDNIITRPTVEDTAAMEDIITRPTVEDTAAMEDFITRPTVEKTAAMEDIITAPSKPVVTYVSPARPHGNGGGRNGSGGKGSSPSDAPGTPFKKGGRVDKALGGRVRDI